MKIFIALFYFLLLTIVTYSQTSKNYRIFPSPTTQTEVFITRHPRNSNILFATANTIKFQPSFFVSEGVYVSTNLGVSWYGSDTCKGSVIQAHGGDPSIAIDKNGTFILTRLGRAPFYGLYAHYSTDNGVNWSSQIAISSDDLERAITVADNSPTSNYFGNVYSVWVRFSPPYPVLFASSQDGGRNWITPKQINNPPQRCSGGDIAVDAEGNIYACWAGVINVSPFTEVYAGFAKSTTGGSIWSVQENAFSMKGIQGTLQQKQNIRVNGIPRIDVDRTNGSRRGWIYIVTSQKGLAPAGNDPDIILNRSTDGGLTWADGIRVNQDPINNGKTQFFPAVHVDTTGAINILYYDDRNTTNDSSGVFLSRSTDGGNTWIDFEISDHNFKPEPIGGLGQGYQGDNIGLTSSQGFLFPIWMDNSTGIYQAWSAKIEIAKLTNVETKSNNLDINFKLFQNYPNPFNDRTIISFTLPKTSPVKLKVFDLLGRELITLISGEKSAGDYQVEFNPSQVGSTTTKALPSGVYLYQLVYDSKIETRKMILLK